MNSVTLTDLSNRKLLIPGSFNELSRKQLINLVNWLYATGDESRKRYRMLCELFNVNSNPFNTWLFRRKLKPIALYKMLPLTDFVFKESDLTKNLIQSVRIPFAWYKLHGPEDYLNNITFIEFIKCERFFSKFQKTGKVELLDKLIAVLYRRAKKNYNPFADNDGDIRVKYIDNNKLIDLNAKKIARLPIKTRLAILHFYTGSRNFIFNHPAYRSVFKKVDKIVDIKQKKNIKEDHSWEKALMNMANSVKEIDDIAYTRFTTVLSHLNEKIETSKRELEAIKKSNP